MKAIRVHRLGGPEVLSLDDIDLPAPAPGEVRVRHTVIGVNFIDTYFRTGLYKLGELPARLGQEGVGVVEALGQNVGTLKAGDRVAYNAGARGSYAEANNVPAANLVKIPDNVSDEIAAASLLKGMTAQMLLKRVFKVKPGDTILFYAIAGGVGVIACQWAKHLGATIIGTVGSEEKAKLAKANGCDHVLNLRTDDIVARVKEITGGAKVPVVYDSVGKDTFITSLDCLAPRGLMVSFGNASGPVPPFDTLLLSQKGSLYVTRPTLATYAGNAKDLNETANDLFAMLGSGKIKVEIGQRFKLSEARAAHEALASRATTGATVLIP